MRTGLCLWDCWEVELEDIGRDNGGRVVISGERVAYGWVLDVELDEEGRTAAASEGKLWVLRRWGARMTGSGTTGSLGGLGMSSAGRSLHRRSLMDMRLLDMVGGWGAGAAGAAAEVFDVESGRAAGRERG